MTKNKKEDNNNRKREQVLRITIAGFALAFLFIVMFLVSTKKETVNIAPAVTSETLPVSIGRHPLTGLPIYDVVDLPNVYGVMIDNQVDAWPQSGLDKAFLVFEAPVEAGISRMLAFYFEGQDIEKIGPVRSARPYFIDWNNELDATYTHVGGSNAALDKIESGGTIDLNQYWNGTFFWRSSDRYAPHNVYTSTTLLETRDAPSPLYEPWIFKESDVNQQVKGENIHLSFYPPTYVVDWKYDSATNLYKRFQAGSAHLMQDGAQIMTDNVAVMITDVQILDAVGRRKIKTIGEGDAIVFQDGKRIDARWKKTSENQRLRFYRMDETEITFNAGSTWIEVIGDESQVE